MVSSLLTNLVAYWKFTDLTDSLGNHNVTAQGNAAVGAGGIIGNGLILDGTGDYVNAANHADFNLTRPFSINVWIKLNGVPASFVIIGKTDSGPNDGFDLRITGAGATIDLVKYGIAAQAKNFGESLTTGVWYMITAVQGTTNVEYYLNGNSLGTVSNSSAFTANTDDLTIGASPAGDSGDAFGVIDEVGYWTKALTNDEVSTLYNEGAGLTYPFEVTPPVIPPTADPDRAGYKHHSRFLKTNYPFTTGLTAGTTSQTGRTENLIPEESFVTDDRSGL